MKVLNAKPNQTNKIIKAMTKPINLSTEHYIDLIDDIPVSSPFNKILCSLIKSEIKTLFENEVNKVISMHHLLGPF